MPCQISSAFNIFNIAEPGLEYLIIIKVTIKSWVYSQSRGVQFAPEVCDGGPIVYIASWEEQSNLNDTKNTPGYGAWLWWQRLDLQ